MPFVHLAQTIHPCIPPEKRDDGSKLVIGDIWECHEEVNGNRCMTRWRWSENQMDGSFWSRQRT